MDRRYIAQNGDTLPSDVLNGGCGVICLYNSLMLLDWLTLYHVGTVPLSSIVGAFQLTKNGKSGFVTIGTT